MRLPQVRHLHNQTSKMKVIRVKNNISKLWLQENSPWKIPHENSIYQTPSGKSSPENFHLENSHLDYSHQFD